MAGGGDDKLLIALTGLRTRKEAREIAVELYGPERDGGVGNRPLGSFADAPQLERARKFLEQRQDYRAMAAGPWLIRRFRSAALPDLSITAGASRPCAVA